MHPPAKLLLLLLALGLPARAREAIESLTLDPKVVVSVPVATNRVTTLSFPRAITALDASGVSIDPRHPGLFQLSHTKGSTFLSLRALVPGATANLNVRLQGTTYVFELTESRVPILALNLVLPATPVAPGAPRLSPTRLLALLDKAKAFPLLQAQHPGAVANARARVATNTTDFGDFAIQLVEILRFEPEDSLVFRALITNRSDLPLSYAPESFKVRAGHRLYHQSISEASGVVPPRGWEIVYFAITGAPDGARADLSISNDFTVLVTRLSAPPPPASPPAPAAAEPAPTRDATPTPTPDATAPPQVP